MLLGILRREVVVVEAVVGRDTVSDLGRAADLQDQDSIPAAEVVVVVEDSQSARKDGFRRLNTPTKMKMSRE